MRDGKGHQFVALQRIIGIALLREIELVLFPIGGKISFNLTPSGRNFHYGFRNLCVGGYGEVGTPLPIPNREVKHFSVDGTGFSRESRTPPTQRILKPFSLKNSIFHGVGKASSKLRPHFFNCFFKRWFDSKDFIKTSNLEDFNDLGVVGNQEKFSVIIMDSIQAAY